LGFIQEHWLSLLQQIDNLSYLGMGVYVLAYILATLVLIPASFLTLGAGAIYGLPRGSLLVSVASILAATSAFLVGRYLARDVVARAIARDARFQAIDGAVGREGWKIVGLTRLSPLFPFVILNYAFSITKVSLRDFVLASWLGMLPGTVMYVYIGASIPDVALLGTRSGERSPIEWGFYFVGLVATIAVSLYASRLARKALQELRELVSHPIKSVK
jgi:uncharacterized membrane protein YdjX (TVP38/TMEM64 family)